MKRSYYGRCMIAAVSKNTKRPLHALHKILYKKSPSKKSFMNLMENLRKKKQLRQNDVRKNNKRFKKSLFVSNVSDLSYGDNASKLDMDPDEFLRQKEEIINNMKEIAIRREDIQLQTVDQYQNAQWNEVRRKLLTASNFGQIINCRKDTGCGNIVKTILYNTEIMAPSLDYGKENEAIATIQLQDILGEPIRDCGLFIDDEYFFLGGTPDGLVGDNGLVEIKCPYSAMNMTPEEGILNKKIDFWNINKDGSIGNIKKKTKIPFSSSGTDESGKKNILYICGVDIKRH